MAAGRYFEKHRKRNSFETVGPIVTKFKLGLRLSTPEMILGSKMKFCKIQDGRRPPIEIYKGDNNVETVSPKWTKFGRNHPLGTPNRKISLKILNFAIQDGRRPPF